MNCSPISQVEAYWEELRGHCPVPRRADLDPRRIDGALERTFILERIAPGIARFRLAGMYLNELVGMEVRGLPLTTLFASHARGTISDSLDHLFEEPAKIRLRLRAEGGLGKPGLWAELILLPLVNDLGHTSRAIGCLDGVGSIGLAPRNFLVERREVLPLQRVAAPFADGAAPPAFDRAESSAFAEPRERYRSLRSASAAAEAAQSAQRLRAERPYLRLVRPNE